MKSLVAVLGLLALGVEGIAQQPTIASDGIFNAASYAPPGLPNGGIARGSMFVIFGYDLGPLEFMQANSYPLPTAQGLAGTSVEVTVGGTTVPAIMIYTAFRQVGAVMPSRVPAGDGTVTVTYNGHKSAPAPIRVVDHAFGVFTLNQAGSGQAIVQNWYSATDVRFNTFLESGRAGQVAILWGTGLGAVAGDEAAAPPVQADMTDLSVEVFVGGRPADILYRGRSGFTGIDQINFRYPSDLNGCRLPLTVRVGGVLSNFGAVAVAPNEGACSDPTSFPGQVMTEIAKMNEVRLGAIKLQRIAARIRTPEEDVSFVFDLAEGGIFFYPTRFFLASLDYFSVYTPLGTCRIDGFLNTHNEDFFASDPTATAGLDAGPVLNLTGPNGTQVLARLPEGEYEKDLGGGYPGEVQLPPFLSPGTYTIDNGAGGFEVGPFRATLSFPAPLNWTNRDSLQNISRSEDLKLTWNGADANTEFVVIVGTSTDYDKNARATFTCTERADAGAFTVPQMFLSALPASAGDWQNQEMPSGILMVGTASQLSSATFQAPGAGFGYFIRMHLDAINVMFQ